MICKHDILGLTQLQPFDFSKHDYVVCSSINKEQIVKTEIRRSIADDQLWKSTIRLNGSYHCSIFVNCYGISYYLCLGDYSNIISSKNLSYALRNRKLYEPIYLKAKPC